MESITPRININGDKADTVKQDWLAVRDAAQTLAYALRQVTPHGRNYQTVGAEVYSAARDQHLALMRQIEALETLTTTVWLEIDDQGPT